MAKKKVMKAEVVAPEVALKGPFLISVLVLMVSLVNSICGEHLGKGKLSKEDGAKVLKFVEESINNAFPEVAPMIMGMFGMELLQLMPLIKSPDKVVKAMVAEYTKQAQDALKDSQPNTK